MEWDGLDRIQVTLFHDTDTDTDTDTDIYIYISI